MKRPNRFRALIALRARSLLLLSTAWVALSVAEGSGTAVNPPTEQPSQAVMTEIECARRFRAEHDPSQAYAVLAGIVKSEGPDFQKRAALLEMALTAIEEDALPKAQQILSQYAQRYNGDPHMAAILLCQGQLYRRMGADKMALAKFYAVMTTVLNLPSGQVVDYQRLVAQAQTEIADTYYEGGDFGEASNLLLRLLKQDSPHVDMVRTEFRLIRCLNKLNRQAEVITHATEFLKQAADPLEQVEVRFYLIHALQQTDHPQEARQQLWEFLQVKPDNAALDPQSWRSWQRRAGNEIGNQLYAEGDYVNALVVYLGLLQLDESRGWRFPLLYQIGLIHERLEQPQKASEAYAEIVATKMSATELANPTLKLIADLAQWRIDHLAWLTKAEQINHNLRIGKMPASTETAQTTPREDPKP